MSGLNPVTGQSLSPVTDDYIRRSVADILTTPIGSRVMRRDYGSYLPELIDQPMNELTRLRIFGATAMALMRWHRRCRLKSVQLTGTGSSVSLKLNLVRTDLPRRQSLWVDIPLFN